MPDRTFTWENYKQSSPEFQAEILRDLDERMKEMTAKQIVDELTGAPDYVILSFLPSLPDEVQVAVYRKCLPVSAYKYAADVLSEGAKVKLGLKPKQARKYGLC